MIYIYIRRAIFFGIFFSRRQLAPNSTRLSDWAHVTGVTSQGPSGLSGLLMKEMPAAARKTALPWILQYCRISKQWPAFLFHVVWAAIFLELQNSCEAKAIKKLQKQYFIWKEDLQLWDAPWRSAPDRIMPGTDAGSAPQESWHGSVLKPVFEQIRRKPATNCEPSASCTAGNTTGRQAIPRLARNRPISGPAHPRGRCAIEKRRPHLRKILVGLGQASTMARPKRQHLDAGSHLERQNRLERIHRKEQSVQRPHA